jgi:hypothetical protein
MSNKRKRSAHPASVHNRVHKRVHRRVQRQVHKRVDNRSGRQQVCVNSIRYSFRSFSFQQWPNLVRQLCYRPCFQRKRSGIRVRSLEGSAVQNPQLLHHDEHLLHKPTCTIDSSQCLCCFMELDTHFKHLGAPHLLPEGGGRLLTRSSCEKHPHCP